MRADREYVANLIEVVEELKQRVLNETTQVEECAGDDFLEETAILRNLAMQLEGLKLRLRKTLLH
jgi:hypothetical protein